MSVPSMQMSAYHLKSPLSLMVLQMACACAFAYVVCVTFVPPATCCKLLLYVETKALLLRCHVLLAVHRQHCFDNVSSRHTHMLNIHNGIGEDTAVEQVHCWLRRLCRCMSGRERTHGGSSCAQQQQLACSTCASTQMHVQLHRLQAQFHCLPACVIWISGLLMWYAMPLLPWPALQWGQMSRYVGSSHGSNSSGCCCRCPLDLAFADSL